MSDNEDRVINRKVTDIRDGADGVIVDFNDGGRVKVALIGPKGGVRYYARRSAGNVLKSRKVSYATKRN